MVAIASRVVGDSLPLCYGSTLIFAAATPAEAIGGAVYALIHHQVKTNGPEAMAELAPMATYMTLAPFIGADEAYERATEESDKW